MICGAEGRICAEAEKMVAEHTSPQILVNSLVFSKVIMFFCR
ncbi:hypothetical protein PPHE_a0498 [Pseudoalteromonas phenolica O-BC30]|nr:hypothetical protein [Pseudoalteromonas phenolica O-BC30]